MFSTGVGDENIDGCNRTDVFTELVVTCVSGTFVSFSVEIDSSIVICLSTSANETAFNVEGEEKVREEVEEKVLLKIALANKFCSTSGVSDVCESVLSSEFVLNNLFTSLGDEDTG